MWLEVISWLSALTNSEQVRAYACIADICIPHDFEWCASSNWSRRGKYSTNNAI
jgi:hypothetical protein